MRDERLNRGRMAYVGDAWRLSLSAAARGGLPTLGCPAERPPRWKSARRRRRTVARERANENRASRRRATASTASSGSSAATLSRKSIYFDDLWASTRRTPGGRSRRRPTAAAGHTATTVDRRVAVFGGRHKEDDGDHDYFGGNQHSVWFYDVAGDAWEEAPALTDVGPKARDHHAAAYVDGGLYAAGGAERVTGGKTTDLAAEAQDDLWRFDVATRTRRRRDLRRRRRRRHARRVSIPEATY
ncbi:galactose oxidase [Aureococcus anophagefferens]|nr:galactose oxidase [Aureococcus anophagefferens]